MQYQYGVLDDNDEASTSVTPSTKILNVEQLKSDIYNKKEVLLSGRLKPEKEQTSISSELIDVICEALSSCQAEILCLDQNDLKDPQLGKIIRSSKTIKTMDLSGNEVGEESSNALSDLLSHKNCLLQKLVLNNAQIHSSTFVTICNSLKTNKSLTDLSVVVDTKQSLRIGKGGYTKFAEALLSNKDLLLTNIDLSGNKSLRGKRYVQKKIASAIEKNARLLKFGFKGLFDTETENLIDQTIVRNKKILELSNSGSEVVAIPSEVPHDDPQPNSCLPGDSMAVKSRAVTEIGATQKNNFYNQFQSLFIAILNLALQEDQDTASVSSGECTIHEDAALSITSDLVNFSELKNIINDNEENIGLLAEYIARHSSLNKIIEKYYIHAHFEGDIFTINGCTIPKEVVDVSRILVELILQHYGQSGVPPAINKAFGDKLCKMLSDEIAKRESEYVKKREFGVAVDLPLHRNNDAVFVEVFRHQVTSPSVAIDIGTQPNNSPSSSSVSLLSGICVIL
jgi:hypothetical protein